MEQKRGNDADLFLGLFVLIALIFLACGWAWLKSFSPLRPSQRVYVSFHDVAGLNPNAAVYTNGVRIGTVAGMQLQGKAKVLVVLKIDPGQIVLPQGSGFTILTDGIVGAKYVEVFLPDPNADSLPKPLDESTVTVGTDPIRLEIVANKIAANLDENKIEELHERITSDMDRLTRAADNVSKLSERALPAIDRAGPLEEKLSQCIQELQFMSKKVNKILSNPNFSDDLKQTAAKANETAQHIQLSIRDLNQTLADKSLRGDLVTAMESLDQSADHVQMTIGSINKMAGDKDLRTDMKHILSETQSVLDRVDHLVNEPGFGSDLRETLADTRDTVRRVDTVAAQVNQILNKRHPLLHLIVGRPGFIKQEEPARNKTLTSN